jgi:hypothetical protein
MKTNELRIGNWVKRNLPTDMTYAKVLEIIHNGLLVQDKDGYIGCSMNFIEPIELTEELMLNIGFKKVFQSKMTKGKFELNVDMEDNEFLNIVYHVYASGNTNLNITQRRCASLCDDSIDKSGIKYLHQLQNAYYLLTNEELEVKL